MVKEIKLSQGKYALVDDSDYERVSQYKWWAAEVGVTKHFYATTSTYKPRKTIYMHRLILDAPKGKIVDHINGNGLDNRRANLRLCTNAQNLHNAPAQKNNTSGYKGVSWNKGNKKWQAQICVNNKKIMIGVFADKIEAAKAYDKAALEFHGKFAYTNFEH